MYHHFPSQSIIFPTNVNLGWVKRIWIKISCHSIFMIKLSKEIIYSHDIYSISYVTLFDYFLQLLPSRCWKVSILHQNIMKFESIWCNCRSENLYCFLKKEENIMLNVPLWKQTHIFSTLQHHWSNKLYWDII